MKNNISVLYDHQIFALQKVGGISRYYAELLKKLPTIGCTTSIPPIYSENLYIKNNKQLPFVPKNLNPKIKGRLNEYVSRLSSKKALKRFQYDVFHPTYYSTYHLGNSRSPFVVTVYDMIHEIYPEHFRNPAEIINNKKKLLFAADKVIAISHHTKEDILRFINIDPEKIEVTHLATSIKDVVQKEMNLPFKKYILFVGQRKGYKNFKVLAEAFAQISNINPEYFLLCLGGGEFNKEEESFLSGLKIRSQVFQKNVSDAELAWAYKNAATFVFPSYYEGFGIPILESMSFGTLTILSKTSCFPEIAQDAALYFTKTDELSEILATVLREESKHNAFREKGLSLAASYTWEKVARETLEVYKKLV